MLRSNLNLSDVDFFRLDLAVLAVIGALRLRLILALLLPNDLHRARAVVLRSTFAESVCHHFDL